MRRALRPCPTPGCPGLTDQPKGCPTCRATTMRTRPYDSAWTAFAADYLATHPTCERCRLRPAREVHHRDAVAIAPHRRLDPTNPMAVCHDCHRTLTPTVRADGGSTRRRHR